MAADISGVLARLRLHQNHCPFRLLSTPNHESSSAFVPSRDGSVSKRGQMNCVRIPRSVERCPPRHRQP